MPMTQKEAREFVDPLTTNNWRIIERTRHLAFYELTFKRLTFYRLDVWKNVPKFDNQLMKFQRCMQMETMHYFKGEGEGIVGESCGISYIARAVYEADRNSDNAES